MPGAMVRRTYGSGFGSTARTCASGLQTSPGPETLRVRVPGRKYEPGASWVSVGQTGSEPGIGSGAAGASSVELGLGVMGPGGEGVDSGTTTGVGVGSGVCSHHLLYVRSRALCDLSAELRHCHMGTPAAFEFGTGPSYTLHDS